MYVATLIAPQLTDSMLSDMAHEFTTDCVAGRLAAPIRWIDEGYAADLLFEPNAEFIAADAADLAAALKQRTEALSESGHRVALSLDVIVQPLADREKQLLVADMDSTMITVECIDELADYAGLKPQIAAITEAAMRGELDFEAALDARVALLKGLDAGAIDRCREERVRLMPGARTLVQTMKARGATCVLVSGGFTRFAEPVAAEIGFSRAIANVLEIEGDRLAGTARKPIVGAATKKATLLEERVRLGLSPAQTLAVGDGANDLAMIEEAGLGVAYHAKPVVAAAAGARIDRGDLTALLWAQGIPRREWVVN